MSHKARKPNTPGAPPPNPYYKSPTTNNSDKLDRVISRVDEREGGEQIEITAQISLPQDGGWGWVVVASSFLNIFILDGVTYTFGSLLHDISEDLKVAETLVAFLNSIAVALYFIASPLASALINRFGFRVCAMSGAILCSFSLLISQFTHKFASLCTFYGVLAGLGYCFINMSSGLVVGFYFEKLRPVALAISTCGSSLGVMTLFPINSYLVSLGGWRATTLLHSGMFGLVFFLSMTFRPLLSLTISKSEDDVTRTITYLPSLMSAAADVRSTTTSTRTLPSRPDLVSTKTERLFGAVSNVNFPTAAKVIAEADLQETVSQPGPSTAAQSKLKLVPHQSQRDMSPQKLKHVQSIISNSSAKHKAIVIESTEKGLKKKKQSCWARLCHWEPHVPQSRPMYRDDAFYDGKLSNLPEYKKSVIDTSTGASGGLDYRLAVTRTAALADIQEHTGIYTTAVRRVLATMMDPVLLKKCSFLLMCASGFFTYLGFLVPYVFLKDRNIQAGVDSWHCTFFISAIGLSNAFGRLGLGALAGIVDPLKLFSISCIIAGLTTMCSHLSYNLYYQYCYCGLFGFFIASVACLRSLILVSLYGLEKLTNATGMMLIFLGLGNLISTPIAGVLKSRYGYNVAFYVAGGFITLSGIFLIPVRAISKREIMRTVTEK